MEEVVCSIGKCLLRHPRWQHGCMRDRMEWEKPSKYLRVPEGLNSALHLAHRDKFNDGGGSSCRGSFYDYDHTLP